MLTKEAVIWGYRYLLGREPENLTVADGHLTHHANWQAFRKALLASAEYTTASPSIPHISKWVVSEVLDGERLMWVDLADEYVSRGCLLDAYEPLETDVVRRHLCPTDTFLDIGANIGWFTMVASTIVGEGGHIHSFEPRSPTGSYLKRSILLNNLGDKVTLHHSGLSNINGEVTLVWEPATKNPGHSYLVDDGAPPHKKVEVQTINVRRLDDLQIGKVDMIKMDVEGAELLVLDGARRTVETYRPMILSEIYPEQLKAVSKALTQDFFDWLRARNYRSFIVDSVKRGQEIFEFPSNWHKELVNVLFVQADHTAKCEWLRGDASR